MKIFKSEDGLFDIVSKFITCAGIAFGAWAYFHTIHPVFEKEIELQTLRVEAQYLVSETDKLNSSLNELKQNRKNLEANLESLATEQAALREGIVAKEQALKEVVTSLKTASDAAVLNKLQYYSDKIMSAYLLAVASGKKSSFDVLLYSRQLLKTHTPDSKDEFDMRAYEYFEMYVQKHHNDEINSDQAIEFAISLFFNYKIDLLKQHTTIKLIGNDFGASGANKP